MRESWGGGEVAALEEILHDDILPKNTYFSIDAFEGDWDYIKVGVENVSPSDSDIIKRRLLNHPLGLKIKDYRYNARSKEVTFLVCCYIKEEYIVYKCDSKGKKGEVLGTFDTSREARAFTQTLSEGWIVEEYRTNISGRVEFGMSWANY